MGSAFPPICESKKRQGGCAADRCGRNTFFKISRQRRADSTMKASEFFPKEIVEVLGAADKNTPILANMALRMTLRAGLFLAGFLALEMSELAEVSTKPPKEALLIANGKYSHFAGLAHPGADASKLSAALEQLGFRVRVVRDGNREQMLDAISEFERGLQNTGAIAFFHYGGHGVQVDGKNYLRILRSQTDHNYRSRPTS
jgi:hypothetical protein